MPSLRVDEPKKRAQGVSIMLNWISGLTSNGRLDDAMHHLEAAVKALGIQWFAADHEAKLACGQLVIVSSLGQLFALYAINAAAKRERTRQASGTLFTTHSRTINDMIQYVLYHRALNPEPLRQEPEAQRAHPRELRS